MRTAILLALLAAPAAGQVCTGDVDGNGTVTIADVIAVVNQTLGECGTPATTCPYTFSEPTHDGDPYCAFVGTPSLGCDRVQAEASWISDGEHIVVILPDLYVFARVTSPTTADIEAWFRDSDGDPAYDMTGQVILSGPQLGIFPKRTNGATVDGCILTRYWGNFTEIRH